MNAMIEKAYLSAAMGFEAARSHSAKGCYDAFASRYDKLFADAQERKGEIIRDYILERGMAGGNALELGCGTGILTERLAPIFENTVGVDFSSEMLELARRRCRNFANVDFLQADVLELELAGARFDVIASLGLMPHIPQKRAIEWARRMKALLSPSGHMLIAISPAPWRLFAFKRPIDEPSFVDLPLFAAYNAFMRTFGVEAHCWYWRPGLLENLLKEAGFSTVRIVKDDLLIIDAGMP